MIRSRASHIVLGMLVVLLASCRLDVVADARINPDTSGVVSLTLRLDPDLVAELDRLAIDPTAEVVAVADAAEAWDVERRVDGDGAVRVVVSRATQDLADLAFAFRELVDDLDEADPALIVDLEPLERDGELVVAGTVLLRPPSSPLMAVDGEPVGPTDEELAELTRSGVDAAFSLSLPGEIVRHDADHEDGATLVWAAPAGEERSFEAVARPSSGRWGWTVAVTALVVGASAVGLGWWLRRRG